MKIYAALASAAAVGALAIPMSVAAQDGKATTIAKANLRALNNSGASGQAELRLSADHKTLTVLIQARGLEAGGDHISHIHGLSENGVAVDSTCPTTAQDADHDGFVELAEGATTYGPILIDFMNIDPDQDGRVNFKTTVNLTGSEMALPLQMRHIVIHGRSVGAVGAGTPGEVDGTAGYKTVLPVLCGEITPVGNNAMQFRKVGG
jgi:Cu/Zn superoxide dismutase